MVKDDIPSDTFVDVEYYKYLYEDYKIPILGNKNIYDQRAANASREVIIKKERFPSKYISNVIFFTTRNHRNVQYIGDMGRTDKAIRKHEQMDGLQNYISFKFNYSSKMNLPYIRNSIDQRLGFNYGERIFIPTIAISSIIKKPLKLGQKGEILGPSSLEVITFDAKNLKNKLKKRLRLKERLKEIKK